MEKYKYLIAPFLAYILAHIIKFLVDNEKNSSLIDKVFRSGGMPSAHTAFIVALTTLIALNLGIESVSFAIMIALTAIVAYDAMNVRRTVGDYAEVIKKLLPNKNIYLQKIHYSKGHNIIEVIIGAVCGMIVAFLIQWVLA